MHILLVDDHDLFREALVLTLQQLDPNATIVAARSAVEAHEAVARSPDLDLILLDLGLPDLDGLTLLPELRDLAPTVPLAVLSANDDPRTVDRALRLGAAGFIPKSVRNQEMRIALRCILEGDLYLPSNSPGGR